jgi:hypothetical protein
MSAIVSDLCEQVKRRKVIASKRLSQNPARLMEY